MSHGEADRAAASQERHSPPRWTTVERHLTPMGDTYLIQRRGNEWRGVVQKSEHDLRVQCIPTYSPLVVRDYMRVVNASQAECMRGENPFVLQAYAVAYRDRSKRLAK